MRRNLILLNLLLVALIGVVGWQFWGGYKERLARQEAFLKAPLPAAPFALVSIPALPGQVSAANYYEIASTLPFSKDRNPTVIVEVAAPKPQPAFPRYYGMMNWGGGPKVILAAAPGGPQKSYVPGDKVGEFKLVTIAQSGLVFEWDGKKLPARYDEMKDTSGGAQQNTTTQGATPSSSGVQTVGGGSTSASGDSPVKKVTEPVVNVVTNTRGPGGDIGGGIRGCQPNDPTPAGAIVDGFRKMLTETPFGKSCRWERVQ